MRGTAIRDSVCAVLVLLAVALGVTMCMHSAGCALFGSPEASEAAYTAEHLRCVDKSATLAESHACRDAVDKRWGITHVLRDAGGER